MFCLGHRPRFRRCPCPNRVSTSQDKPIGFNGLVTGQVKLITIDGFCKGRVAEEVYDRGVVDVGGAIF